MLLNQHLIDANYGNRWVEISEKTYDDIYEKIADEHALYNLDDKNDDTFDGLKTKKYIGRVINVENVVDHNRPTIVWGTDHTIKELRFFLRLADNYGATETIITFIRALYSSVET